MMKKFMGIILATSTLNSAVAISPLQAKLELKKLYEANCRTPSDIYQHIPILYRLSKECSSVVEIGLRTMNSTWGILYGLTESSAAIRRYVGIDLNCPPAQYFVPAQTFSKEAGLVFKFIQGNDMDLDIEETDLLFIDSLHTYCHLTYELEKFSSKVRKYIAMHDTDEPWGFINDFQQYSGDYSEYPAHISRTRKGLWAAVEDFLKAHPEWTLHERHFNNHGFTVLKRVSK